MPAWLIGALTAFGSWLVERLAKYLISLGVFGATYVGVNILINKVVDNIAASIGGGVGAAWDVLMMAGFGVALNITISASAFVLTQRATSKITGGGE